MNVYKKSFGIMSAIEEGKMSEPPSTHKYSQSDTVMNIECLRGTLRGAHET
jgi:hypothetical protein